MTCNLLTSEMLEVALTLMEGLDCPRSLTVAILMREGDWEQLMKLECLPATYDTAERYRGAVCATDFLRKIEASIPGIDPATATFKKWLDAEQQCFKTNSRFNEIADFGTLNGLPVSDAILDFIQRAKRALIFLIGERPPEIWDGKFGPGATMSDRSGRTTVAHKMSTSPTLTPSAAFYLVPWVGTKWARACVSRGDDVSFVRGNAYFSVPKTALVHRPCAKEPALNAFYQLGLGSVLKRRLKRAGINLQTGQDTHRQVACAGSLTGDLATIDLSSASDTLAWAVVKALLPPAWFHALNDLRSAYTRVGKSWYRLEKFSSMGNGFTFELETAVFAAIAMACGEYLVPGHNLLVYGDDIIVPVDNASNVISALKFFGFTTNKSKTFVNGPFRESCGGDYYLGEPVRAHFVKELPHEPQDYISLANGIRRILGQFGPNSPFSPGLRRAWFRTLDNIPSSVRRCRGPEGLGDIVIHDDESRWHIRWRSSIRWIRCYRPAKLDTVKFCRFDSTIQYAAALYGVVLHPTRPKTGWPEGFDNRGLPLRDGVLGYKVGWVPFS